MQPRVAPLGAGPPLELQIEGRALMFAGVAALTAALAIVLCISIAVLPRTGLGILSAVLLLVTGDWLSRQDNNRRWWTGGCLIVSGYSLLVFIAHASFYMEGVAGLDSPVPCWLLKLATAGVAAVHATRHSALRWLSLLFSAGLTADVMVRALSSTDVVHVGNLRCETAAVASLLGTTWLAVLCEWYQHISRVESTSKAEALFRRTARGVAELYFAATAVSAMSVPYFWHSVQYVPVWWAVMALLLLRICWRSEDFVKHWLVMGVWALSAVLVLVADKTIEPLIRMAVPLSGLVMALAYHRFATERSRFERQAAYTFYLYGSALLAVAVPFFHLGVWDAVPFFLVEAAIFLTVALLLKDRLLHGYSLVLALASVTLFECLWQSWDTVTTALVVAACYGFSLMYGRIYQLKGWPSDNKVQEGALHRRPTVATREARVLEIAFGAAGYGTLMFGIWLLLPYPANTISWGVAALSLILFGFAVDKIGHRASGVIGIFATCAKLWILDLSGAGAGLRTFVGFVAVGVCLITAGIFYLVEYVIKTGKPKNDNNADQSDKTDSDDETGGQ